MRESDYYPEGAYNDPSAPYNQYEPDEKEFDVTCSQTLSKTVTVYTTNYEDEVDEEYDDEGHKCGYYWCDTSSVDWKEEYAENDYHTPAQLIALFKRYLEDMVNGTETSSKSPSFLKRLIEECDGWCEDDTEFVQD